MSFETTNNTEKKSPTQRFLFVIGLFFFGLYFCLGIVLIFWDFLKINFPLYLPPNYRTALGVVIIIYAFLRFIRYFKKP
jgi:succinate dehydrogenase/fumarate reductase cytochrome b subunit